jgi:hypothetical protein
MPSFTPNPYLTVPNRPSALSEACIETLENLNVLPQRVEFLTSDLEALRLMETRNEPNLLTQTIRIG